MGIKKLRMNKKYLKEHVGGIFESLDCPESKFIHEIGWLVVLLHIYRHICFVRFPWLHFNTIPTHHHMFIYLLSQHHHTFQTYKIYGLYIFNFLPETK